MLLPDVDTVFSSSGPIPTLGLSTAEVAQCIEWLKGAVRQRAYDAEHEADLAAYLEADGFDGTDLQAILLATEEPLSEKDIGEAIAEVALQAREGAIWPTNRRRDMRSVRASLPGADIVGFVPGLDGKYRFLLAEVKTSSDRKTPPSIMYGDKGLEYQLYALALDTNILRRLLKYLFVRVKGTPQFELWRHALRELAIDLESGKKLVGVLVRDTQPAAADLSHHAELLGKKLGGKGDVSLLALYIGIPAKDWPLHCTPY
ncbi:hypothetical protein [Cupriavidus taiwanensis]|uniref:hypothetical protein n=1 Tax=Cupriavidus taiwanensis TaxID=164546 RepID=UPI000E165A61|nr:hypothetical protein [Cupriavidus taiwanensis]SPC18351.1 conserved hypothetical protein [Cupriavidus taiwanensis]